MIGNVTKSRFRNSLGRKAKNDIDQIVPNSYLGVKKCDSEPKRPDKNDAVLSETPYQDQPG